ncbi:unnamed protein product [Ceratitis capitata]|uniref:(Mediterranean fruit fly) hypothetical protein n=1 Tax=Ceratitis capitata TaxID=7213 RepID=A0A811UXC8_CERCA|nr:unnamed protein product [Ceratitis capitata]
MRRFRGIPEDTSFVCQPTHTLAHRQLDLPQHQHRSASHPAIQPSIHLAIHSSIHRVPTAGLSARTCAMRPFASNIKYVVCWNDRCNDYGFSISISIGININCNTTEVTITTITFVMKTVTKKSIRSSEDINELQFGLQIQTYISNSTKSINPTHIQYQFLLKWFLHWQSIIGSLEYR